MEFTEKVRSVQKHLENENIDGWLLYDFRRSNRLACQFLGIPPGQHLSRRFFYWIPKEGEPQKIVHNVEAHVLDSLLGKRRVYSTWQELKTQLEEVLSGFKTVLMEYSPSCAIPYVSQVDGGTLELVKSMGVVVKSSADLLQNYTAVLDEEERESHLRAAEVLDSVAQKGWQFIGDALRNSRIITEFDVQQYILQQFAENGCMTSDSPICAVNGNAANPHYTPSKKQCMPIKKGDFVLLDIWCKVDKPKAIYADICRVAVADTKPTDRQQEVFDIVKNARDTATTLVKKRFGIKQRLEGWEVDQAARDVIADAGYSDYFIHRTGHNIGTETHGDGTHMDNYETHDCRQVLPSTCFSIEPGIYIPGELGIRLEYDVLIHPDGLVQVTGGIQEKIHCLLA